MEKVILRVNNLTKKFGGITAVDNFSLGVKENSITGLIGPNGSGKTTVFNLIFNLINRDAGEVYFKKKCIDTLKPREFARIGISRTFQNVKLFWKLTTLKNMAVAGLKYGSWEERAIKLLEFVGIIHLKNENAENLSYGQQKLLEFAMALMTGSQCIMLDEPVSGVNPKLINDLMSHIKELRDGGKTFFIIEHNMPFIMNICDKVVVLDHGQKIAEGPKEAIQNDERVIDAYLGAPNNVERE